MMSPKNIRLTDYIRNIPDFPVKGILFRDITPLLADKNALAASTEALAQPFADTQIDYIAAVEARGFIFGAAVAKILNAGFIPIRKKGKLPPETIEKEYSLEYGTNVLEISKHALMKGEKVVIVDDLLATGGTVAATAALVESLGAEIVECAFIVELPELKGREKLKGYKISAFTEFEGE